GAGVGDVVGPRQDRAVGGSRQRLHVLTRADEQADDRPGRPGLDRVEPAALTVRGEERLVAGDQPVERIELDVWHEPRKDRVLVREFAEAREEPLSRLVLMHGQAELLEVVLTG